MSVRPAHLLAAALISVCLSASAFAKTTHHTSSKSKSAEATGPSLIWRGDDATADGVVDEVAQAWESTGHGRIELQPFNTASGLDAVSTGTADLAGSARGTDGSAEDSKLTFTPVAWDALVIVANASNPVSNLTLQQLHDIYYGKITNWSDLGGSSAPIDVYAVASPGDGVEFSLRQLLFGRGNQPVAAPRLYVNTHKLEEGVSLNPNGMGAATYADARSNPKLKILSINGIAPSASTIGNGSYLLYTPLYLVTNPNSPKAAQVSEFLAFLQTEPAKAAMRRHAVIPYQDGAALAAADGERRSKILAAVGAHVSHLPTITTPSNTVASSPASNAVVAGTVASSVNAGKSTAEAKPTKTELSGVKGSVETRSTSLAHVHGSVLASRKLSKKAARKADDAPAANAHHGKTHTAQASEAGGASYIVAKGDTLFSIAKKHGVDVAQLRSWNHLKDNDVKPGQTLRVGAR